MAHVLGNDALDNESVSLVQVRLLQYAAYELANFLDAKRRIEMVIRIVKVLDDFFIDIFRFRYGFSRYNFLRTSVLT